jgi:hypothetical protein
LGVDGYTKLACGASGNFGLREGLCDKRLHFQVKTYHEGEEHAGGREEVPNIMVVIEVKQIAWVIVGA